MIGAKRSTYGLSLFCVSFIDPRGNESRSSVGQDVGDLQLDIRIYVGLICIIKWPRNQIFRLKFNKEGTPKSVVWLFRKLEQIVRIEFAYHKPLIDGLKFPGLNTGINDRSTPKKSEKHSLE